MKCKNIINGIFILLISSCSDVTSESDMLNWMFGSKKKEDSSSKQEKVDQHTSDTLASSSYPPRKSEDRYTPKNNSDPNKSSYHSQNEGDEIKELQWIILEKKLNLKKELDKIDKADMDLASKKEQIESHAKYKEKQRRKEIRQEEKMLEANIQELEMQNKDLEENNKKIFTEIEKLVNSIGNQQPTNDFNKSEYDKKMMNFEKKRNREKQKIETKWKSNGFKSFGEYIGSIKEMNSRIDKGKNELLNSSFTTKNKNHNDLELLLNQLLMQYDSNNTSIKLNNKLIVSAKNNLTVLRGYDIL